MFKKILLDQENNKYYVTDTAKDFHTKYGYLKAADLQSSKSMITSNTSHQFHSFSPTFSDLFDKIKRGPQIITRKDIGLIIAKTGINKNSVVLDAGTGSGALACFLASIAKKAISYEREERWIAIAEQNKQFLGLKNLTIKYHDIYQGIPEKNIDVIILDLPEPQRVLPHLNALKSGGFLVTYLPSISQVAIFVDELQKHPSLIHLETVELLKREWVIEPPIVRPDFQMLGHTGFLTFCRKA